MKVIKKAPAWSDASQLREEVGGHPLLAGVVVREAADGVELEVPEGVPGWAVDGLLQGHRPRKLLDAIEQAEAAFDQAGTPVQQKAAIKRVFAAQRAFLTALAGP